jgi:peptidoglycan/LPS O-acetylase OafA/YrhL
MPAHTDLSPPPTRAVGGITGGELGYRPALDGLRAVAITLVLLHHTAAFLIPAWQSSLFPGGFLGVDLFMVLSGFLITTLLLQRHDREQRPILTFYLRRALRLIPAVLALLLANLIYAVVEGGGVADALRSIAVVLAYVTNWAALAGVALSRYVTHLWSLAIEEQFYLVWPLLLFTALRLWPSRRRLAWLAISMAVLAAAWRAALYQSGDGWLRIYLRTDARADALAIGAALALLPRAWIARAIGPRMRSLTGTAALAVVILAAALLAPDARVLYLGGFTVVAIAAAVLIASVLEPESGLARALSARPLVLLGRLSYALYLWHFGIFQVVAAHTAGWATAPRVLLGWSLTLIAAVASYRFIELPALRLKGRLGRRALGGRAGRAEAEPPVTTPAGVTGANVDPSHRAESGPGSQAS